MDRDINFIGLETKAHVRFDTESIYLFKGSSPKSLYFSVTQYFLGTQVIVIVSVSGDNNETNCLETSASAVPGILYTDWLRFLFSCGKKY